MAEVQKADPRARRTALIVVVCGAVAGVILIRMAREFGTDLDTWVQQDFDARLPLVIGVLTLFTSGPLLALAVYLWFLGERIVRAERYPPREWRVVRDTPVVAGDAARRVGRFVKTIAVGVGAAGAIVGVLVWRLLSLVGARAA